MSRVRRTIPLGKPAAPAVEVARLDLSEEGHRALVVAVKAAPVPRFEGAPGEGRKDNFPSPDFEPSGVETEGLPPGVRIRWFRSLVARPFVVAPSSAMPAPPKGAIVWTDAAICVDLTELGAAAVATLPPEQEGPRTLSEPGADAPAAPTLREAVAGALGAVPAALREGASAEVEGALAAVGL